MDIYDIFKTRQKNPLYNTSYPLCPSDWKAYRMDRSLAFDLGDVSFYVHIPFCQQLCSFCEYTRIRIPVEQLQRLYVDRLETDMRSFANTLREGYRLQGFDVGGGTPTALTDDVFAQLMNLCKSIMNRIDKCADFEPSIEGTFQTISKEKLKMMVEGGFHRLSLGVQSSNSDVLSNSNRQISNIQEMKNVLLEAHDSGIRKVNLDFMYGLHHQTLQSINDDLQVVSILRPEQVTLYELRTNMIKKPGNTTHEERYAMYSQYYEGLTSMGYRAPFGQNTFTIFPDDMGASSYLRHRMVDCTPYKGFGLSAQSMSSEGVSYNIGKNSLGLAKLLDSPSYKEEYTYLLPPRERASKYIAIAAYSGAFALPTLDRILNDDSRQVFAPQFDFCLNEGLLIHDKDKMRITRKGFKYYGAVFSLFYNN